MRLMIEVDDNIYKKYQELIGEHIDISTLISQMITQTVLLEAVNPQVIDSFVEHTTSEFRAVGQKVQSKSIKLA